MTYDICIYIVLFCSYMYLYYIHIYIYIYMFDIWFLDIKSLHFGHQITGFCFPPRFTRWLHTQGATNRGLAGLVAANMVSGSRNACVKLREISTANVCLHPGRLTWNIIMEVWKIIFLSKWLISRFHVNLPGCSWWFYMDSTLPMVNHHHHELGNRFFVMFVKPPKKQI